MVKKTLRTGLIKSFSSISSTYSNLTYYFFFVSQIPIYSISFILGISSSKNSDFKMESTFSKSSYLQNFEKINIIIQYLKDKTLY